MTSNVVFHSSGFVIVDIHLTVFNARQHIDIQKCIARYMLLPVCASVRRVDQLKTVGVWIMKFSPYSCLQCKFHRESLTGSSRAEASHEGRAEKLAIFYSFKRQYL